MSRITPKFDALKAENRAALIPFIMAGDPDYDTSLALLKQLPSAGADLIELGMCFTDPMADGPAIQTAGLRALKSGQTLRKTLRMVAEFREQDTTTPIILMGYYNPIYIFGVEDFLRTAKHAGVDGLILVDLPPEEDEELCLPAKAAGLDFIRLATPTTDDQRLRSVIKNTSGFLYYVSVVGITGGTAGAKKTVSQAVQRLKNAANLPVAVGFGIKTPEQAREIAKTADAIVVGTALVEKLAGALEEGAKSCDTTSKDVLKLVEALAHAVRSAR